MGRSLFWDILSVAFRITKQWTTQRILKALPIVLIRSWDKNILIHFSYKRVEVVRDIGFHFTINTNQRIYGKKLLCNIMWMHNLFVEQNVKITPKFSTPSSISVRLTSCLANPLPPSRYPKSMLIIASARGQSAESSQCIFMTYYDYHWAPFLLHFHNSCTRLRNLPPPLFILFLSLGNSVVP